MVKTIQKVQLLHYCQNWCVCQSVLLKTTDINKKAVGNVQLRWVLTYRKQSCLIMHI